MGTLEPRGRPLARALVSALGILVPLWVLFRLEIPAPTLFWNALFDAGHAPLFGVIALSLLSLLRLSPHWAADSGARPYLAAFAAATALGGLTELVQLRDPLRYASWTDWLRDAAGAASFLLAAAGCRKAPKITPLARTGALVLSILLLTVVAAPLVQVVGIYRERAAALPILCDFQSAWQERFLRAAGVDLRLVPPPEGWPTSGPARVARLTFPPGRYPGFTLHEPYPDWGGYERLVVEVYSDVARTVPVAIRIHDRDHDHRYEDRFNRTLSVERGYHRWEIPLEEIRRAPTGRELDLRRVDGIIVFVPRNLETVRLDFGPLRLE
jgi:VanZ family protein